MDLNRIKNIMQKVSDMLVEPSLDMEVCEDSNPPCIKITYTVENDKHTKTIDIFDELLAKSDDEVANFIVFQVEQFMEEIDSVEYGGE